MNLKIKILVLCIITIIMPLLFSYTETGIAQGLPTLRQGSRGEHVTNAQRKLHQWGYYKGNVDGIFGPKTDEAVKFFQRSNGLTVDGVIGPQTWRALGFDPGRAAPAARGADRPAVPAGVGNEGDINLLARLIHGEARGEPYKGKVAVAAVILNRVRSPEFPNTLSGVIYQPLAFESISNGQAYIGMDDEAIRAARDAINGWDPTYGCLYFWNPAKPVSKWIWTRQIVVRIGNHVFGI